MFTKNITVANKDEIIGIIESFIPSSNLIQDICDNNYYHNDEETESLVILDFSAIYLNIEKDIHVNIEFYNTHELFKKWMDTLQENHEKIEELKKEISFLNNENDELEEKNFTINRTNEIFHSWLGEKEQTIQVYRDRMIESEKGKSQFLKKATNLIDEKNKELKELHEMIEELEEMNNNQSYSIQCLLEENAELKAENENQENEINNLNEFICSLQKRLYFDRVEKAKLEKRIKHYREVIKSKISKIIKLENQIEENQN